MVIPASWLVIKELPSGGTTEIRVAIVLFFLSILGRGGIDVHMFNLCEKLCNFEKSALRVSFL